MKQRAEEDICGRGGPSAQAEFGACASDWRQQCWEFSATATVGVSMRELGVYLRISWRAESKDRDELDERNLISPESLTSNKKGRRKLWWGTKL